MDPKLLLATIATEFNYQGVARSPKAARRRVPLIPDTAEGSVDRCQGVPPDPATRADVQRVVGLYGGVRHAFDENLTVASPWLAAGGR